MTNDEKTKFLTAEFDNFNIRWIPLLFNLWLDGSGGLREYEE